MPAPNAWSVPFVLIIKGRSRPLSTIKKKSAVLKKAMADKHSKWHSKAWSSSKDRWNEAQSSQGVWIFNCKDARWTDVTRDLECLQKVGYDKQTIWHKSMKETLGRDNDLMVTMENTVQDDKEEYKHKVAREQLEYQLRREEEEAIEAKQFWKEMLRNVENADARVERTRQRFSEEFVSS